MTLVKGFSATLPDAAVQALSNNPNVAAIEADQVVTKSVTEQVPATWGLDRIDQRLLPLTTSYRYASTASNVTAFIVDTGIRATHTEFGSFLLQLLISHSCSNQDEHA